MSHLTIRGLDPAIERKIRRIAKKKGKSLNRVILDMVYQSAGLKIQEWKPAAHSLKKLAGGWSEKDASEFEESIKSCEQIGDLASDRYSRIAIQLKRQGTPIPTNDIWIAAQTMEHGAELITSDQHFEKINGLVYTIFPL